MVDGFNVGLPRLAPSFIQVGSQLANAFLTAREAKAARAEREAERRARQIAEASALARRQRERQEDRMHDINMLRMRQAGTASASASGGTGGRGPSVAEQRLGMDRTAAAIFPRVLEQLRRDPARINALREAVSAKDTSMILTPEGRDALVEGELRALAEQEAMRATLAGEAYRFSDIARDPRAEAAIARQGTPDTYVGPQETPLLPSQNVLRQQADAAANPWARPGTAASRVLGDAGGQPQAAPAMRPADPNNPADLMSAVPATGDPSAIASRILADLGRPATPEDAAAQEEARRAQRDVYDKPVARERRMREVVRLRREAEQLHASVATPLADDDPPEEKARRLEVYRRLREIGARIDQLKDQHLRGGEAAQPGAGADR